MDEFEQSDLEKQTADSHNATYQNAIHYKERENAFMKKIIKPGLHIVVHSPHEIISTAGKTGHNSRRKRNQS